jgi:hypothetical protein
MEISPLEFQFTPSQQTFLKRLARATRDVGYILLASAVFALMAAIFEAISQWPQGTTDEVMAWLSSYVNGNRNMPWGWFKELLIEIPFETAIGWSLVQAGLRWYAIAEQPDHHLEALFSGFEQLLRTFRLIYLRTVIAIGLIWVFVIFT